jgi:hypothetical protein
LLRRTRNFCQQHFVAAPRWYQQAAHLPNRLYRRHAAAHQPRQGAAAALQRAVGVDTCRVLIKIATLWLAIQAAATRGAY